MAGTGQRFAVIRKEMKKEIEIRDPEGKQGQSQREPQMTKPIEW